MKGDIVHPSSSPKTPKTVSFRLPDDHQDKSTLNTHTGKLLKVDTPTPARGDGPSVLPLSSPVISVARTGQAEKMTVRPPLRIADIDERSIVPVAFGGSLHLPIGAGVWAAPGGPKSKATMASHAIVSVTENVREEDDESPFVELHRRATFLTMTHTHIKLEFTDRSVAPQWKAHAEEVVEHSDGVTVHLIEHNKPQIWVPSDRQSDAPRLTLDELAVLKDVHIHICQARITTTSDQGKTVVSRIRKSQFAAFLKDVDTSGSAPVFTVIGKKGLREWIARFDGVNVKECHGNEHVQRLVFSYAKPKIMPNRRGVMRPRPTEITFARDLRYSASGIDDGKHAKTTQRKEAWPEAPGGDESSSETVFTLESSGSRSSSSSSTSFSKSGSRTSDSKMNPVHLGLGAPITDFSNVVAPSPVWVGVGEGRYSATFRGIALDSPGQITIEVPHGDLEDRLRDPSLNRGAREMVDTLNQNGSSSTFVISPNTGTGTSGLTVYKDTSW